MTKKLTLTIEISDGEYEALISRFSGTDRPVSTGADASSSTETATTATTASGSGTVDMTALDVNGVPWLESVHAGTKAKIGDGSWRGKVGVSKEQRAAAEAPYRNKPAGGEAFQVPASIVTPGAAPGSAPVTIPAGLPGFPPAGAPVGLPGFPPAAPPPVSYDQIAARYGELAAAGKVTAEMVPIIYQRAGVSDVAELMTNESLRRKLMDVFETVAAGTFA